MSICQKLRDDGRLGDDLAIVNQCWHEAPGIDFKVGWVPGPVKVNQNLLKREAEFRKNDMCPVCP